MAYDLQLSDDIAMYLKALRLSIYAKARLDQFVEYAIANVEDEFRLDPANRLKPDLPLFVRDFFLVDVWGDDRWHRIEFTMNDSHAAVGVLVIVFMDHSDGEWTW